MQENYGCGNREKPCNDSGWLVPELFSGVS
jgi:hypothetical protein